ncbi:hypothetical protein HHK36_032428 [Tetracentron sinense]|uniref:Uncharacterized protein n=1 Tax=Tetracentron sinense TaxID=13715 RepID=A0A834Y851_TETSI|nr:hypothetical protein HHK36_032428 [Tetracentron sinense]
MSNNRSRAEKNEAHFRKPARSGSSSQQRSFSGSSGKKGGGGTAPPPSSSINSSSSLTTNRSFKGSNAQGGLSRVIATSGNSDSAAAHGHDGPCEQSSLSGASDAPVSGDSVRPNVASTQRSTPAVPRPPSSQSATGASDLMAPTTPAKVLVLMAMDITSSFNLLILFSILLASVVVYVVHWRLGDVSVAFPLQFGTISPSFMNGMQIPARTSSAPPNLDEQKRDQARHDSLRAVPTFPIPSVPKQQQPKKDVGVVNKSNTGEPHYLVQVKRDVHAQIPAVPDAIQSQRSFVRPNIGMSMPMPQVPVQFGGPNRQIQSQGMTATSRQMSVSLVGGNTAQLPPQVFASNLQSHSLQPQGMIHQGQNMSFPPQMGHQLVPQLGKLGFGIPPQVAQQVGNFGVPRKVVKITHPETHEELTALYLDGGSLGLRLHPNVPLQSQPISSFTPDHQINSYSSMQTNSFNPTSIIFQSPTSHPLTNMQMTPSSPASRFNYQVNQAPQTASSMNPSSFNPFSVTMSGAPMHSIAETSILHCAPDAHTVAASFAPSPSVQVRVKPASGSLEEKIRHSVSVNSHVNKGESPKLLGPPGEALSFHPQRVSVSLSENSLQLSKPGPEPSTSIPLSVKAKYSAASSSAISFERLLPSTSSSAPDVPAEESTPVLTNTESRRETVRKSDSIKDHQKKPGGKALQHSQPQHQADASDPAGSSNSSLLKSSGEVAKYPKHMQAPPSKVVGSTASLSSWPSQGLESGSSLKDGNSETVENKAIPTPSETRDSVLESTEEPLTDICGGVPGPSETVAGSFQIGAGSICEPSNSSSDNLDAVHNAKGNECTLQEVQLKQETMGSAERGKPELPEGPTHDSNDFEINDGPASSESVEVGKQTEWGSNLKETSVGNGLGFVETKQEHNEEAMECNAEVDTMIDNCIRSTTSLDSDDAEINLSIFVSSPASCEDKTSTLDATTSRSEGTGCQEVLFTETSVSQSALVPTSFYSDTTSKPEGKGAKNNSAGSVSIPVSGSKDKSILEPKKAKISNLRGHKKRREILQKADAAGTNTDLYMAYKHPEEKQETTISLESKYSTSSIDVKQVPADATAKNVVASEEDGQGKDEPDDWEDAAEISSPKLKILDIGEQIQGGLVDHDEDVNGVLGKKYSRDFLLTISKQCTHLPADFEITSDIAKALVAKVDRDSYPSSGRIIDRLTGVSQPDRQGSGMVDDDKWSKLPGTSGWDPRLEIGLGGTAVDFRPSQGGNHGFLRNPRGQIPGQHVGGILPGPMQSPVSHGGIQRNGPDADRWQKGLIPSPHAPLQVMHKAEKKYEVRKVSDKEETKQRQLKAILNKLTPQNFEKLLSKSKR